MSPRVRRDPVSVIALLVAVAACAGLVIAVPSTLPGWLRTVVGLAPHRVAAAPEVSGTGTYAYLVAQPDDPNAPVGYDPCRRIALRINLELAPYDGLSLVRRAMTEIEGATGLRFDYQGTTSSRPQWKSESVPSIFGRPRSTPVLVSWATAEEVPELAGDVAGLGGSVPAADLGGVARFATGGVTLDAEAFAQLARTEDGRREAYAIVLHEFGHLVGLGHVHDPQELMNADILGMRDFGPGDRLGLAKVGSTSCA